MYWTTSATPSLIHPRINSAISSSTVAKATRSLFPTAQLRKRSTANLIYGKMLESSWNYRADVGENPRELEKAQIIRLMSLIAEKIYIGKFDDEIGTRQLENKIQKGEDVPPRHLRAYRMAKEEILYCWLDYIGQIVEYHFVQLGKAFNKERLFQYQFPEQLWTNIGNFLENLARLPVWVDHAASSTVFGGKQTNNFWHSIFETGTS